MQNLIKLTAAAMLSATTALAGNYDTGASDTEIKIGTIVPLSGPASAYGSVGACFEGYYEQLNEKGGINGRKVSVTVLDDGYNPAKSIEQARRLVERDGVLLVVGNVGTPPNSAIHRYMNQKKVPHLFILSGASKWADPDNYPWTMSYLPSYASEARIYAKHVLNEMPNAKVAILYQNDDFGNDYRNAFTEGLGDKADMIVAQASYDVSNPTVESQVSILKESGADVFLNIASPRFAAQAIRTAHELGWEQTQFLVQVSNAVGAVLEPAGFEAAQGIISTQYLKDPSDPRFADDPEFAEWRAFRDGYFETGSDKKWWDWVCYSQASLLTSVLTEAGDDLTRENVMKIATSLKDARPPMLLPGITVSTSEDDYNVIEQMELVRFKGETWNAFGDLISAK